MTGTGTDADAAPVTSAEANGTAGLRGPLRGVRILDLGTMIAAPYGASLLADFGADVIKIELPGGGDSSRALLPHLDGYSLRHATLNRNKRCVTLDLRSDAGRDLLLRLVAQSDLLLENFRPGTLDRYGLDLATRTPGIVGSCQLHEMRGRSPAYTRLTTCLLYTSPSPRD